MNFKEVVVSSLYKINSTAEHEEIVKHFADKLNWKKVSDALVLEKLSGVDESAEGTIYSLRNLETSEYYILKKINDIENKDTLTHELEWNQRLDVDLAVKDLINNEVIGIHEDGWMIMQYGGQTLSKFLQENPDLEIKQEFDLYAKMLRTIPDDKFDIKPANIFIKNLPNLDQVTFTHFDQNLAGTSLPEQSSSNCRDILNHYLPRGNDTEDLNARMGLDFSNICELGALEKRFSLVQEKLLGITNSIQNKDSDKIKFFSLCIADCYSSSETSEDLARNLEELCTDYKQLQKLEKSDNKYNLNLDIINDCYGSSCLIPEEGLGRIPKVTWQIYKELEAKKNPNIKDEMDNFRKKHIQDFLEFFNFDITEYESNSEMYDIEISSPKTAPAHKIRFLSWSEGLVPKDNTNLDIDNTNSGFDQTDFLLNMLCAPIIATDNNPELDQLLGAIFDVSKMFKNFKDSDPELYTELRNIILLAPKNERFDLLNAIGTYVDIKSSQLGEFGIGRCRSWKKEILGANGILGRSGDATKEAFTLFRHSIKRSSLRRYNSILGGICKKLRTIKTLFSAIRRRFKKTFFGGDYYNNSFSFKNGDAGRVSNIKSINSQLQALGGG